MATPFNSPDLYPGAPVPRLFTTVMGRIADWMHAARNDWPVNGKDLVEYLRPINFDEAYLAQATDNADLERRVENLQYARSRWY